MSLPDRTKEQEGKMKRTQFATGIDLRDADDRFRNRFWSKVAIGDPDECWEWTAYRKPNGYGQFMLRKGRFVTASRIALALKLGIIEDGLSACHTCDNPPCCNPGHLFAGSSSDNLIDCVQKGRKNAARGEGTGAARLTEDQVQAILAEPQRYGMNRDLGRKYGVHDSVIRGIRSREYWAYLGIPANSSAVCTKGHPLSGENLLPKPDRSRRTLCATCAEEFRVSRLVKRAS